MVSHSKLILELLHGNIEHALLARLLAQQVGGHVLALDQKRPVETQDLLEVAFRDVCDRD